MYLPRRGAAPVGAQQVQTTSSAARAMKSRPLREAPLGKAIVMPQGASSIRQLLCSKLRTGARRAPGIAR